MIGKARRQIVGAPHEFVPNGVSMPPDRQFLLAKLGAGGGVWRLDRNVPLADRGCRTGAMAPSNGQ